MLTQLLPSEEVFGLLNIFREMDADKNGVISLSEMQVRGLHTRFV